MKKILLIVISSLFLVTTGCSSLSAKEAYNEFKSNVEKSAQIHTIELEDGSLVKYFYNSDSSYGYFQETGSVNCGKDKDKEVGAQCETLKQSIVATYDSTFGEFFSKEYSNKFKEKSDYYEATEEYEQGGKYKVRVFNDGKKVVWKDEEATYTVELVKKAKIPDTDVTETEEAAE